MKTYMVRTTSPDGKAMDLHGVPGDILRAAVVLAGGPAKWDPDQPDALDRLLPDLTGDLIRRVQAIKPLRDIAEWMRGCSCGSVEHPEECLECTRALIEAIKRWLIHDLPESR